MKDFKIHDITKKDAGDFYRFKVIDIKNGHFDLLMEEKPWTEKWGTTIRIETSAKRLEQLANEILNYLNKKVKWEEWKPTVEDFAQRLEEIRPECGVELWFIDWVRNAVTLGKEADIAQARRIYEWLRSNEKWLYGKR